MKNLLKMGDLSPAELTHILDVADRLKADCKAVSYTHLRAHET